MASLTPPLSVTLFVVFMIFARPTFSIVSPESPPSPSPQPPSTPSPSPAHFNSPPASPPSDLAPKSPSQAPSPAANKKYPSPAPAPAVAGHVRHEDRSDAGDSDRKEDSSGGMSGGKKAGVSIGVIAAACVVGIGAVVYKKRKQNIQRSQYSYTARREIL